MENFGDLSEDKIIALQFSLPQRPLTDYQDGMKIFTREIGTCESLFTYKRRGLRRMRVVELRVASCSCELQLRVASCSCELRCSCELQTDKIKIFLILDKVR